MRQLLSHSIPCGSDWNQVLEYVSDKVIQQKDKSREIVKRNQSRATKDRDKAEATGSLVNQRLKKTQSEPKGTATVGRYSHLDIESIEQPINVAKTNNAEHPIIAAQASHFAKPIISARKHIPMATQRKVFNRDRCCQYCDKTSGKQCGSNWQPTIDHIHPIWANGTNELENLRVLCAAHNRAIYRQQANLR